ncbi:hypothetical protein MAALD49_31390 [Marinobacter shengliensis]|nr:hypothetical protein MAALD49_31390 [Marinobacter shengliensis]
MKNLILITAITTLFSTMATAGGLADRINEERSYPNKTDYTESMYMNCMHEKKCRDMTEKHQVNRDQSRKVNHEKNNSKRQPANSTHH